jgi:hypothetical protein
MPLPGRFQADEFAWEPCCPADCHGVDGDVFDIHRYEEHSVSRPGRFSEKEAKPIANQNSKLLRVRLGEPFMARQGAMVAYQGNVDFSFEGGAQASSSTRR